MIFGPFPQFIIERLKSLLDQESASYRIFYSQQEITDFQSVNQNRTVELYPEFNNANLLYIEIPTESLLIVSGELEKIGSPIKHQYNGELETSDYLCTSCDYHSDQPGICPKHRRRLLEFSEWNAYQNAKKEQSQRPGNVWISIIVATLFLLGFIALTAPSKP